VIAYYRKTLGVMGAVLVVAVGSAVYSNGWAERERGEYEASMDAARAADSKAEKAEKTVRECAEQMVPVEMFLQSWKAYLPNPGREGELAMALRSTLEDAAQKKLGLVVDTAPWRSNSRAAPAYPGGQINASVVRRLVVCCSKSL
jgi:hypothetical protein